MVETAKKEKKTKQKKSPKSKKKPLKAKKEKDKKASKKLERYQNFDDFLESVKDEYGDHVVHWAADYADCEIIPTGILGLDRILPYNGLPKGRIVEIIGAEGAGKTTLSYQIIHQIQQQGYSAALYDSEFRFFGPYATACGINVAKPKMLLIHPEYAEKGLNICEKCIRSGLYDLVVIDSVAGLVPKEEYEGAMDDQQRGLQARVIGKALRKLIGAVANSNSILLFVNQIREKIGVKFGSPETTPGGRALRFFSSVRLDLRVEAYLSRTVASKSMPYGIQTKVRIKKAMGGEKRVGSYTSVYQQGFDAVTDVILVGKELGVIVKDGAYYKFLGQAFNGLPKTKEALRTDEKLFKDTYTAVRKEFVENV